MSSMLSLPSIASKYRFCIGVIGRIRSLYVWARLIRTAAAPGGNRSSTQTVSAIRMRYIVKPSILRELYSLGFSEAFVSIYESTMTNHCAAKKLDGGIKLLQGKFRHPLCLGKTCDHTTPRAVRRLPGPSAECQPGSVKKVKQLRHRICPVLRVQQSIGKFRFITEVRSGAQDRLQRMSRRQHFESSDKISDRFIRSGNTEPPAELLQHVNSGSSIRRVHHKVHRSVWLEHIAQSRQTCVGIDEMMQNPGADDLIEALLQLACLLDSQLLYLKVLEIVFAFQIFCSAETYPAEVNTCDLRLRPSHRILRRLRRSTTGDENRKVFLIRPIGPKQMKVRYALLTVVPDASIVVEIIDWPRVGIPLVEVLDFF